jgi:hypothetical protein
MAQETKELVLQDICERLLYGLHVRIYNHWTDSFEDEILTIDNISEILHNFPIEDIKPYLRPMSSMTEEERRYLLEELGFDEDLENGELNDFGSYVYRSVNVLLLFDWLNAHHFDYRGLIPMGLALEAPEEMYKTE